MEGDIATVMRMTERLIGVLIGGMCVYLGYRLFMALPDKTDSSGKVILPGGIDIKLSRIGPGVFFALFGISVVISSHFHSIETHTAEKTNPTQAEEVSFHGLGTAMAAPPLENSRLLANAENHILHLNLALQEQLNPALDPEQRDQLEQAITYAKHEILRNVWNSDWGEFSKFDAWLKQSMPQPIPEKLRKPAAIFNLGRNAAL